MNGTVSTHVKEHKVPYLVSLLIPLAPIAVAVVSQNSHTDAVLQSHFLTEEHPATELKLTQLTKQVNLGLELQLAKEIHGIMKKRCDEQDTSFDAQLERLQTAYKGITGLRYPQIRCGSVG